MPSSASRFCRRALLAKAYSEPRTPRRQRMSQNVSTPAALQRREESRLGEAINTEGDEFHG